uniref:Uncharacterized protein n=1 Tax=Lactuca sativa TaxID=4236 RepID=A0A9R1WUM1_LACSA|nr:hypothetical protein LSAT_V11C900476420 [Lactuca sativa]
MFFKVLYYHLFSFQYAKAKEKYFSLRGMKQIRIVMQVEHEMETMVKVLQHGPLGIIGHNFYAEEITKANSIVKKAVENWKRNEIIEKNRPLLKDYLN